MNWASLILPVLKLALALFSWAQSRQLIKAGEDAAVAKAALELLDKTEEGKRLRERIRSLSDSEADDLLDRIGKAQ